MTDYKTVVTHKDKKIRFIKWLRVILFAYVGVGIALYFLQDRFFIHPVSLSPDYTFKFQDSFKEFLVDYDNTTTFDVIKFMSRSKPKRGAVIYFHGNMDNINYYARFASIFTQHGYDVWMMDYPSFGKSTGQFSEKMLYTEALEVYKMTRAAGYSPDSIIIYGKSLGTGIAAQLASIRDCKKLILECPYFSVANVAAYYCWMYPVDWMVRYRIPTYQYIQKVTAPVIIFHGTEDHTIPFSNSEKLRAFLKTGDEFIPIKNGDHNNLNDFPLMQQKLDSLLSN